MATSEDAGNLKGSLFIQSFVILEAVVCLFFFLFLFQTLVTELIQVPFGLLKIMICK